ncbi:fatty-acid peroxygenase [Lentibacillus halodurans]|uniref:Fatty-acid peroxygenase n=1 Tax=Lentibacillus halodurans TaxID=237679 RepID=A0A1I0Y3L4_9BACI|nr:cytochrome P450 [Lentibacillus halodurans]SFB06998.1 fatty-acid peroxygenase [Lentibacillus halodurans]
MTIPREKGLDHTLTMLSEGYQYILNRRRRFQSDIFQTRLLGGQKVICIGGEEAAEVFYDEEKFKRKGAVPNRIKESLFGKQAVQGLDGAAHKHRKQLFMSLMTRDRLRDLTDITAKQWEIAMDHWHSKRKIVLFHEAEKIMCRIACEWAGVPLFASELNRRTSDLSSMIDAFGAVGPRYWRGRTARNRTERWIRNVIDQVRSGKRNSREDTALYKMAWHRGLNGELLDLQIAAVELINIIRPITAIGRYVTFGALAMHDFPEAKEKLKTGDDAYIRMFVQEVRRYYPFGPYLGAKVRSDFKWGGYHFKKGTLVLLDVYGTNRDPDLWNAPDEFRPERFEEWSESPFNFIPQGGGDYNMGHRCAGEWVTIEVLKVSLGFLAKRVDYKVPKQDLGYSLVRMPSIPKSRFVISDVRK